jgi:predicted nucleic acid-binding protein
MPSKSEPVLIYWDSCVPLAYINGEPGRVVDVRALLDEARRGLWEIVTSTYTVTEVAFAKAEKDASALVPSALSDIDKLWRPPSPIKLVEFHIGIAESARDLLREAVKRGWRLKPGDAIHLATALDMEVVTLHTYNLQDFDRWAGALGFTVENPQPLEAQLDSVD